MVASRRLSLGANAIETRCNRLRVPTKYSGAARISVRGEHLRGLGGGAEPPEAEKNFENFQKILKKIAKCPLFYQIFQKDLIKNALIFRSFGRQTNCWEI